MKKIVSLTVVFALLLNALFGCDAATADAHEHRYVDGVCILCGLECEHDFSEKTGFCSICFAKCKHEAGHGADCICYSCGQYAYHDYVNGVCVYCGATTNIAYDAPEEYKEVCDEQGTVVPYTYHTQNYSYAATFDTELVGVTKNCYVYLPYGYDETEQYNVIYLLHGQLETAEFWLVEEDHFGIPNYTTNVFDWMIKNGDVEPFIAVTPDIHTDYENYDDPSLVDEECVLAERNDDEEFIKMHNAGIENNEIKLYETVYYRELKDLARQVESTYSTYADADGDGSISDEELIASRNHRGLGGFSVGANITLMSGVVSAYDFIGFFGCFSGASIKYKNILLNAGEEIDAAGYSVYLFLETEELTDGSEEIRELYRELVANSDFYVEEQTIKFLDIKSGTHNYKAYMGALYSALHFFFLEDPATGDANR